MQLVLLGDQACRVVLIFHAYLVSLQSLYNIPRLYNIHTVGNRSILTVYLNTCAAAEAEASYQITPEGVADYKD